MTDERTLVSLVSPRRTFARVQPTTRDRVELALCLEGAKPGGLLKPSRVHGSMSVSIPLASTKEFDSEARAWLRRAYKEPSPDGKERTPMIDGASHGKA